MRRTSLLFSLVLSVLSFACPPGAGAQPPFDTGPTRDVCALDAGLVTVTTTWRESRGRRGALVTASLAGAPAITLHDGATVRTALAAAGDTLVVVAFHGGEHAFARALFAHVRGGALTRGATVELDRAIAARRDTLRPAAALAAPTPEGFTILVQEQDVSSPSADVVTTMTRLARDGAIVAAPAQVAIPWALAALAWDGRGYHLAVLWGGWGAEHAGTARACLVTLTPAGQPEQHPWWATGFDALSDVQLVRRADGGAMLLVHRRGDGRTIALHESTGVGSWGTEPPPSVDVGHVEPSAPFVAIVEGPGVRLATP